MRQEVGGLAEQVDAQVVVLDADMNMHAADDEPPRHVLQVLGKDVVALFVGMLLALPLGEGVRGGGDRREAELVGNAADRGAKLDQLVAHLLHRPADPCADLELGAQEFGADLSAQGLFGLGKERGRELRREVARLLVDEEILLLDADAERRFLDRHGTHSLWHNRFRSGRA